MEKKIIIPDAINANINNNYTMINNDILRDPTLSLKAKTLLCLLLSNQKGWKSYKTQIKRSNGPMITLAISVGVPLFLAAIVYFLVRKRAPTGSKVPAWSCSA